MIEGRVDSRQQRAGKPIDIFLLSNIPISEYSTLGYFGRRGGHFSAEIPHRRLFLRRMTFLVWPIGHGVQEASAQSLRLPSKDHNVVNERLTGQG